MPTSRGRCRGIRRGWPAQGALFLGAALALLSLAPVPATSQELADYDYENLSFEGLMVDGGYIDSSASIPRARSGAG